MFQCYSLRTASVKLLKCDLIKQDNINEPHRMEVVGYTIKHLPLRCSEGDVGDVILERNIPSIYYLTTLDSTVHRRPKQCICPGRPKPACLRTVAGNPEKLEGPSCCDSTLLSTAPPYRLRNTPNTSKL